MRKFLLLLAVLVLPLTLCACESNRTAPQGPALTEIAMANGYWRPVSAPNVLMPAQEAQGKLEFDLAQCHCGSFPRNIPTPVMMQYQPDQARMVETSTNGNCLSAGRPIVAECMRARGWEPTLCAGRLPTETGGYCGL